MKETTTEETESPSAVSLGSNKALADPSPSDDEEEDDPEDEARKEALKACKACEHEGEGIHSFIEYDGFYYTPSWVASKTNFPTHCGVCSREILAGSLKYFKEKGLVIDPAKHYHVKGDSSVFLCRNAQQDFHECTYALCKPCRLEACKKRKATNEELSEEPKRRGRRCRKMVDICLPGEAFDPDTGYMVASI